MPDYELSQYKRFTPTKRIAAGRAILVGRAGCRPQGSRDTPFGAIMVSRRNLFGCSCVIDGAESNPWPASQARVGSAITSEAPCNEYNRRPCHIDSCFGTH